jgi:hypothetical protein
MLRITYTGGDAKQRWLFDPDEVDVLEAERIEAELGDGQNWDSFLLSLTTSNARLRRVLLWHLLRRSNPGYNMPFSDTPNFKMGDLVVELGTVEIDRYLDAVNDNPNLTQQQKDRVALGFAVPRIEAALAEAELDPAAVDTDPKEPAPEVPGTPYEDASLRDDRPEAEPAKPGMST